MVECVLHRVARDRRKNDPGLKKAARLGDGTIVIPVSFTVCKRRSQTALIVRLGDGEKLTLPHYADQIKHVDATLRQARAIFN